MGADLDLETIRQAPKALLHDHLDGGLRPATVIELAAEQGYTALPTTDVDELTALVHPRGRAATRWSEYLEAFEHTVGVMQTPDAIERVAAECAEDLAADGVVYAEIRYAPEQHLEARADPRRGGRGRRSPGSPPGSHGRGIVVRSLLSAMRQHAHSTEIAELAVRHRDLGVVGFDIAGPEKGFPPTRHLDAFEYVQRENFHMTIHAGEAFGLPSIWEAIQFCGAERLGHGVRIVDDITYDADGEAQLGRLAAFVRDRRIPLEMCPTSNVADRGGAPRSPSTRSRLLHDLRFRVTVNTDNRLMSDISMSGEFAGLHEAFGWGLAEMRWLTINAMKSAFVPFDERLELIDGVVKPGYEKLLSGAGL